MRDEFGFNMLSDETAVDYWPQEEPRFHVIYQLRDLHRNLLVTLRVPLNGNTPHLETHGKCFPECQLVRARIVGYVWHHPLMDTPTCAAFLCRTIGKATPCAKIIPLGYEEVQFTFNER